MTLTSPKGQQMLSFQPSYLQDSAALADIFQAHGMEMDDFFDALNETLDQFFVDTATWGLDDWEAELGIMPQTGKPDDQRRSVIKSKIRGVGTVTVSLIQSIAEAYENGEVDVTAQPALYQFTVKFVSVRGIPPNIDDLKAVIEEIKPAHLAVVYSYTYTRYEELNGNYTYDQMSTKTYDQLTTQLPA